MRYICIEVCIVADQRFRLGQELPYHLIPKGGEHPYWMKYFQAEETAKRTIQQKRFKELGVDPEKERILGAKIQNIKSEIANTMKMDVETESPVDDLEPLVDKIDFTTITDEEGIKAGTIALAGALKDLGIDVKPDQYSANDLLEMGRDAIISNRNRVRKSKTKKPGRPKGSRNKK